MSEVRTRFSPSPTGFLHIGGARTAFYCWLWARNQGGKFILRVEDTDQERLVPGAISAIVRELDWFGVHPDEGPSHEELRKVGEDPTGLPNFSGNYGPYIQSLRLERYQLAAQKLIDSGHAFRCDCTPEMLEKERLEQMARREVPGYSGYCRDRDVPADKPHVIRFKMPYDTEVVVDDYVRGKVVFQAASLRDPILMKSGGFPTYHLAVVVDDVDMKITHIMRGQEWLATAPLHVLIYKALGFQIPVLVHLPVIMGQNGKKLSKRDGAVSCETFRDSGYLPEALLNFTSLVGWAPGKGEEQEIFSRDELAKRFSLDGINESSGVFDYGKLDWMNGQYIRALSTDEFVARCEPFFEKKGLKLNRSQFDMIAADIKERVKTLKEVPEMVEFLFVDKIERDMASMLDKNINSSKAKEILSAGIDILKGLSDFSKEATEAALRPLGERFGLKLGPVFGVFRVAVIGKKVTPPLFSSFAALGKEITIKRMEEALLLVPQDVA